MIRTGPFSPEETMRDRVPSLDGLRGVAVLLVLWAHVPKGYVPLLDALAKLVLPGYLGVDIFFVLSGFLITRILLYDKVRGRSLRHFLVRRFARIFPIYYLTVLGLGVLDPGLWVLVWAAYLANFSPAFDVAYPPLAHAWSLCIEEHFYLLWPWVVYGLSRAAGRLAAGLGLATLALGSAIAFMAWLPPDLGAYYVVFATPTRVLSLGAGALMAYLEPQLRNLGGGLVPLCIGLLIAGAGTLGLALYRLDSTWMPIARLIGFTAVSSSVVLTGILVSVTGSPLERLLTGRTLVQVGKVSYGLYVYHHPIMYFMLHTGEPGARLEQPALRIGGAIALSFLAAAVSYRLIEAPLLRLSRRRPVEGQGAAARDA